MSMIEEIRIPDNVKFIRVGTFLNCHYLKTIYLPKDLIQIEECAFDGCRELSDVYYPGTEEMFKKIIIDDGNERLEKSTCHFLNE